MELIQGAAWLVFRLAVVALWLAVALVRGVAWLIRAACERWGPEEWRCGP